MHSSGASRRGGANVYLELEIRRRSQGDGAARHALSRHRPRMLATQYSEASMMESRCRHSSCPGLTRVSIYLRKIIFEEYGLPGQARQ